MIAWLTPEDAPTGTVNIMLTVPAGEEWEAILRGALAPLFDSESYEFYGAITPEEAAEYFRANMLQNMAMASCP